MGIMVHHSLRPAGTVEWNYRKMISDGRRYVGARSFVWWEVAVAYALLPSDPRAGRLTDRRRVARGESGRWIVTTTLARPRRPAALHVTRVMGCACERCIGPVL